MTDRQDASDEPGAPPAAEAAHARFPCENCGAALQYRPGADALECPYCGHRNPVRADNPWEAAEALRELDFHAAVASRLDAEETVSARVVHCESCGADVEFDESEEAKTCPFCAAPIVAAPQRHEMLRPRGVLPFLIEEREARKAMTDWLGRLWFAPSGLQEYARKGRRMDGIYTPYWTFDAEADTRYAGQRGDTYFVTRQVRVMVDGKPQMQVRQVPKIRWTRVAGRVRRAFDDVLVLASRSLPRKYADALAPWDLQALEPYSPKFLAGFRAEAYTVGLEEGFAEARDMMDQIIRRDVRFDIGGDQQRIERLDTRISNVTFKHILLPVWLAAYRYRGKTYRFVVNGRTGAVQGERPYSAWKIAAAVILGLLLAGGIGYLVAVSDQVNVQVR